MTNANNTDCFYCGQRTVGHGNVPQRRTRDHIKPRCQGGTETVISCRACNSDKGTLSFEEYRIVRAFRAGVLRRELLSAVAAFSFPGERIPAHLRGR